VLSSCVRPISLAEQGSGGKRFVGSAFIVSSGLHRIVVTAEHVVRGPETKFMGMSIAGSLEWPTQYSRIEPFDSATPLPDVAFAFVEVTPDAEDGIATAISIDLLLASRTFEPGASMVAVGFPGSQARAKSAQTILSAKLMSVVGDLAPEEVYARIGKRSDTHLAMSFRQDACVDENGKPAMASHPRGMSGGAMFVAAYHTGSSGQTRFIPRIVGVLTEYYPDPENIIVAARIECVLDALGIRPEGAAARYRAVDV
jgi:hypothetical protein